MLNPVPLSTRAIVKIRSDEESTNILANYFKIIPYTLDVKTVSQEPLSTWDLELGVAHGAVSSDVKLRSLCCLIIYTNSHGNYNEILP